MQFRIQQAAQKNFNSFKSTIYYHDTLSLDSTATPSSFNVTAKKPTSKITKILVVVRINGARYLKPFHLNYFVISQLLHSIFYISYLNHRDKVHFYRFFDRFLFLRSFYSFFCFFLLYSTQSFRNLLPGS